MPKFLLIDHSLTGFGGHHYEYAAQILSAAGQLGFETHLACGAEASQAPIPTGCDHYYPLFPFPSYGKWSRLYDGRTQLKQLDERSWVSVLNPVSAARELKLGLRRRLRKRQFTQACRALFESITIDRGDHVFLPTMSEFDLLAFSEFIRDTETVTQQATWHIQFHVSFWDGRSLDAKANLGRLHYIRQCFETAKANLDDLAVRFYATTEGLAEHYNRLNIFSFQPLPYPAHSEAADYAATHRKRLRAFTAGKPREEKGASHLPALAADVWNDLLVSGKLQLVIQSPESPAWIDRFRPATAMESAVVAAPFPLNDAQYEEELQRADIGLFLYDSDEYFVRASGVMAEMLARGKPVITPAGCWLSEQGSEQEEAYLNQWRRENGLLKPDAVHEFQAPAGGQADYRELSWDGESTGAIWQCQRQTADCPVRVEMQYHHEDKGWSEAAAFVTRMTTPTTTTYVPVASGTRRVRIRVYNAYGRDAVQLSLNEHRVAEEMGRPRLGHHNLAAADWRSAARLLREMVENYDHYRRAAEQFAHQWTVQHHPRRTIELLTGKTAESQISRAA